MKQLNDEANAVSNDPKEKKIVNEQEQNKPVNTGDQPFEEEEPAIKEPKKEKDESASTNNDDITNKGDSDILNKNPGIQPE